MKKKNQKRNKKHTHTLTRNTGRMNPVDLNHPAQLFGHMLFPHSFRHAYFWHTFFWHTNNSSKASHHQRLQGLPWSDLLILVTVPLLQVLSIYNVKSLLLHIMKVLQHKLIKFIFHFPNVRLVQLVDCALLWGVLLQRSPQVRLPSWKPNSAQSSITQMRTRNVWNSEKLNPEASENLGFQRGQTTNFINTIKPDIWEQSRNAVKEEESDIYFRSDELLRPATTFAANLA